MKKRTEQEFDPKLAQALKQLGQVPPREAHTAARGRARFLAEAGKILPPVSASASQRHKDWRSFSRKERFQMNAVIAVIASLVLLFGGSAATVAAAQDDLPNEPLYAVKTLSEDARLWLNTDPQGELDMLMELANLRIEEMYMLAMEGSTPPAEVTSRLETHIQEALQVAAGMDSQSMQGALEQIHTELMLQQQLMQIMQNQSSGEISQVMEQTRTMVENRIRMVEEGMGNPQGFQNSVRTEEEMRTGQDSSGSGQEQGSEAPGTGNEDPGSGNQQEPSGTPQGPNGPGTGNEDPGSGNQQEPAGTPQGPKGTGTGSGNGGTPGPHGTGNPAGNP